MLVKTKPILDKLGKLLALVINHSYTKPQEELEQQFLTSPTYSQQVAVMNLPKDHRIEPHYHPKQDRKLDCPTAETIIVLDGWLYYKIYDKDNEAVDEGTLRPGVLLILFEGGHHFYAITPVKLLEVKQGPWIEENDKVRFTPIYRE